MYSEKAFDRHVKNRSEEGRSKSQGSSCWYRLVTGYDGWPLSDSRGGGTVEQQGSQSKLSFEMTVTDEGDKYVSRNYRFRKHQI